ncbi:MAG: hypothetical protein U0974_11310 [Gemmatimonadales bacterium]|nr:hypothetical protein [Gemmatimonadales bacterium]
MLQRSGAPDLETTHPLGVDGGIERFGVAVGTREEFVVHPFHSRSYLAAGGTPMRIAIATNPNYRVELWTPTGTLERVVRREGGRRAPTLAERAAAPTLMKRYLEGVDPATANTIMAEVPTPDSLPALVGLTVTPQGELLVQREGFLPSQVSSLWEVFDSSGRWLGELRLPARTRILSVGTDHLLVQRMTVDDVVLIEVHRLRR